jgi:capsular exopolysaccharide synthesis family protein
MDTFATGQSADKRGFTGFNPPRLSPVQQVLSILYRQRKPILIAIAASLVLGAIITFAMPREYTAIASVQLEQQASQVIAVPDLDPQRNVADSERFLQTQVDLLHSRNVAERVAKSLKAAQMPAVRNALRVEAGGHEALVTALQEGVGVKIGTNSRLASITFTSRDATVSALLVNSYAQQLVITNLTSKSDTSSRAREYLTGQLANAKAALQRSEERMLAAVRSADLTTGTALGGVNDGDSLRAQQLGALSAKLAEATARRITAEQQWRQVQGTSPMALPQVYENRAVQELMAQKSQAAAAFAEERQRYTGEYPSETAAKFNRLDSDIRSIASNIKRSFLDSYQTATRQEQSLQQAIGGLRSAALAERERGVEFSSLERDVQTNKAFYDGLLLRYKEVAAAAGAPAVNVAIVDHATPPTSPSSPSIPRNMALALILGMIVAMAIALVRETRHNVIHSALDLGGPDHLAFLGAIPMTTEGRRIEDAVENPQSPQSEAYTSVALAIQQLNGGDLPKCLLVTSCGAGEGKTTTSLSLARSLSRMGHRTLLIDGDMRHPSLAALLDQREGAGLAEALDNAVAPQSVVRTIESLGIDVVCAGKASDRSVNLLARDRMARLVGEFSKQYDAIIVDGPPVLGLADAVLLSRAVEFIVMVVQANLVASDQLSLAVSRLPPAKTIGAVLTKFDAKMAGVEYGTELYYTN